MPILSQCLPLFDEICRRSINFIGSCLSNESSLVGHIFYYLQCTGCWFIYFAEEKFRMRLVDLEKDNSDLRLRVSEAETNSLARESEMGKLRKRLQALEKHNEALQHATNVYQQEREQLEREVLLFSYLCIFNCLNICII